MMIYDLSELKDNDTCLNIASEIIFTAVTRNLYYNAPSNDKIVLPGHNVVIRKDVNGNYVPLGVVSDKYKVHSSARMFNAIERVLFHFFGTPLNMEIVDQMAWDGTKIIRQYIIRKTEQEIGAKSRVMFRVIVSTSYDGTASTVYYAGAIDAFCTNGNISGAFDMSKSRHSTEIKLDALKTFIGDAYITYSRDVEQARALLSIVIPTADAFTLLGKLSESERFRENIKLSYSDNMCYHGANLWAVVSTATWWATTESVSWAVPTSAASVAAAPNRRLERQLIVSKWMKAHIAPYLQAVLEGRPTGLTVTV